MAPRKHGAPGRNLLSEKTYGPVGHIAEKMAAESRNVVEVC